MIEYPSIEASIIKKPIYAFDKIDGQNVRAEWSKKNGFYKFGTRRRLLGSDEYIVGKAPGLIVEEFSKDIEKVCKKKRWDRIVCFFEFSGPKSFAGFHEEKDDHSVRLIDVSVHKVGFLEPSEFVKTFGHLDVASLLYRGNPNSEFIDSVKNRTLPGMTYEGVVCKGKRMSSGLPLMFKVKSNDWYDALRKKCNGDEKLFKELA